jgi:hypothetical protein
MGMQKHNTEIQAADRDRASYQVLLAPSMNRRGPQVKHLVGNGLPVSSS